MLSYLTLSTPAPQLSVEAARALKRKKSLSTASKMMGGSQIGESVCTVQYSTVQYSTGQYNESYGNHENHSTAQCSTEH
jgi:hypothetical protein